MQRSNCFFPFGETLPLPTLLIIPSGIGCEIGGFAGDAIPTARLLAAASGCLITHPNVLNGASLYWNDCRMQYVEGYALDKFATGQIALKGVRHQTIGILFDAALEADLKERHMQVIDGCRATLGLKIGPVLSTDVPLQVRTSLAPSGASWGELGRPDALLRTGEMLKNAGATAIAIITRFPEGHGSDTCDSYRQGQGVDALAGAEAMISHLLVRHLGIPCAHAPGLMPLPLEVGIDPRVAGEELGFTFLSSVLVGLSRAPDYVQLTNNSDSRCSSNQSSEYLYADQIGALVVPSGALGGEAVFASLERSTPVIAVTNPSVLKVNSNILRLKDSVINRNASSFIEASNYIEAAGLITLLREGIALESLQRPLSKIDRT